MFLWFSHQKCSLHGGIYKPFGTTWPHHCCSGHWLPRKDFSQCTAL